MLVALGHRKLELHGILGGLNHGPAKGGDGGGNLQARQLTHRCPYE